MKSRRKHLALCCVGFLESHSPSRTEPLEAGSFQASRPGGWKVTPHGVVWVWVFLLNIQETSVRRKIFIGRHPNEVVYDSSSYLYPAEMGVLLKVRVSIWGKSRQVKLWSHDSEFGVGLSSSWGLHLGFSVTISSFPIFLLSPSMRGWVCECMCMCVCAWDMCLLSLCQICPLNLSAFISPLSASWSSSPQMPGVQGLKHNSPTS